MLAALELWYETRRLAWDIEVLDIEDDEVLEVMYGESIPILLRKLPNDEQPLVVMRWFFDEGSMNQLKFS